MWKASKHWSEASQHHILSSFILSFTYTQYTQYIFRQSRPFYSKMPLDTLYKKFETNIPRNETARPRSYFLHSCICKRFIYSHDRSAYFAVFIVDRSWEYIRSSQIHAFTAHTNRSILRRQIFYSLSIPLHKLLIKQTLAYPIVTAVQSL